LEESSTGYQFSLFKQAVYFLPPPFPLAVSFTKIVQTSYGEGAVFLPWQVMAAFSSSAPAVNGFFYLSLVLLLPSLPPSHVLRLALQSPLIDNGHLPFPRLQPRFTFPLSVVCRCVFFLFPLQLLVDRCCAIVPPFDTSFLLLSFYVKDFSPRKSPCLSSRLNVQRPFFSCQGYFGRHPSFRTSSLCNPLVPAFAFFPEESFLFCTVELFLPLPRDLLRLPFG